MQFTYKTKIGTATVLNRIQTYWYKSNVIENLKV